MEHLDLVLIGFGNVGRAFVSLLEQKRAAIETNYGLSPRIVGILTGRHGGALDPAGIDIKRALGLAQANRDLGELSVIPAPEAGEEFIRRSGGEVVLENTPVNYQSGQPAIRHIEAALEAGMHAVTANKGPIVHAYQRLATTAARHNRRFFFEATVMDGAPIFSIWRNCLPAADLVSFRGVLNSTTNLILTLMETGKSLEESILKAQELGIAETDPSGDVEGWDAAIKVAALVTVLMGIEMSPAQVQRRGIEAISARQIAEARSSDMRWKLVCEAQRGSDGVTARVEPELLRLEDPLYSVMGTSSAITFNSDVLGPLTVIEDNPGPQTTAYGLLADLLSILRHDSPPF